MKILKTFIRARIIEHETSVRLSKKSEKRVKVISHSSRIIFLAVYRASSLELQCMFGHKDYGFKDVGRTYCCTGINFTVTQENETVQSFKRFGSRRKLSEVLSPEYDEDDDDLDRLDDDEMLYNSKYFPATTFDSSAVLCFEFWNGDVHFIPSGIGKSFTQIQSVHITGSRMKSVTKEKLEQFPHLIYLNLASNSIEYLASDLFEFNPGMKYVGFHGNRLVVIRPGIFDKLNQLKAIDLTKNFCVDQLADNETSIINVKRHVKLVCNPALQLTKSNRDHESKAQNETIECESAKKFGSMILIFNLFFGYWP